MKSVQTLGKLLSKSDQKQIKGGTACSFTWQDSNGHWHTEYGTCSHYYNTTDTQIPNAWDLLQGASGGIAYCHTASHTSPSSLSSNGGRSRCA